LTTAAEPAEATIAATAGRAPHDLDLREEAVTPGWKAEADFEVEEAALMESAAILDDEAERETGFAEEESKRN
jgi:hypothetical protein